MIITCPSCSARYVVDPLKIGAQGRTVKCAKCANAWAQPAPTPEEMAGTDTQPAAAQPAATDPAPGPGPAARPSDPPDETSDEEPDARDVAAALGERIGREPAEPDDDFVTETDEDFRTNFDDAFGGDPAPRPLRGAGSSTMPALPRKSSPWPARLAWIALIVVVGGVIGGMLGFQQSISKAWPPSQKLYDLIGMTPEPAQKRLGVRSVRYTYPDKETLRIDGELVNLSKVPHDVPDLRILFLDAAGAVVKRWTFPPPERRMLPDEVVKFVTEVRNPPADAKRIDVGLDEN
jgi:predicted Zn finger-like uncharacterized protein